MEALPWFRLYGEFATDPVVQSLSFDDQRHFVMLLCFKSTGLLDREFPTAQMRSDVIRKSLGLDGKAWDEMKTRLQAVGLVNDELQPKAWDKRQMLSDSSRERVRKYREKRAANGLPKSSGGYLRHWKALLARDGGACVYCGSIENLCIDHVVPVIQGGGDEIENLAIACKSCNSGKAGRTPDQAGMSRRVTVTVTPQEEDKDIDKEEKTKESAPAAPSDVSKEVWKDFQKLRRTLRAPITETAINGIRREATKAGITFEAALRECIERNWRGFKAEWVEKPRGTDDNPWHKTASGIKAKGAEYGLFPSAFLFNGDPERQDWQAFKNAVLAKAGVPA